MLKQQTNVAAIYKRLSRDDGGDAESNSIITQGQMLRRYAKEHGFIVYDEYTDVNYCQRNEKINNKKEEQQKFAGKYNFQKNNNP